LGEDGPTHQPVEHLASLRTIPGLLVIRPADANETVYAWKKAIEHKGSPVALILTRQDVPVLDQTIYPSAEGLNRGAYILLDSQSNPDVILIATGSEVSVTLEAAEKLQGEGINVRVVSMPCRELFEEQPVEYKDAVLPPSVNARVSVEAAVTFGWGKFTGSYGKNIGIDDFGASAPSNVLFEKYGFSAENIYNAAKSLIDR
jgi:transketolase